MTTAVIGATGRVGSEGVLQRIAVKAAAGISSIEQVTRLSVLNTSADSLWINQRAHPGAAGT
jgi:NAD(P)H dehydrogenase (quinone)